MRRRFVRAAAGPLARSPARRRVVRAARFLTPRNTWRMAPMAGSANNIYTILANADFPYPAVGFGRSQEWNRPDTASCARRRRTGQRSRDVRVLQGAWHFRRTLGVTMNSNVRSRLFYSTSRKYTSDPRGVVERPHVPVSVYMRLVRRGNSPRSSLSQAARAVMGVTDDLHYSTTCTRRSSRRFKYSLRANEAQEHVIGAAVARQGLHRHPPPRVAESLE